MCCVHRWYTKNSFDIDLPAIRRTRFEAILFVAKISNFLTPSTSDKPQHECKHDFLSLAPSPRYIVYRANPLYCSNFVVSTVFHASKLFYSHWHESSVRISTSFLDSKPLLIHLSPVSIKKSILPLRGIHYWRPVGHTFRNSISDPEI